MKHQVFLFSLCLIVVSNALRWEEHEVTGDIPLNITGSVFVRKSSTAYLISGQVELYSESFGNSITFNNDVYALNLKTFEWVLIEPEYPGCDAPSPRVYASGAVSKGNIYLYGGTTFESDFSNIQLFADLWEYDISDNQWTLLTDSVGPNTRAASAMHVIDDNLYIFGGIYDILFGVLPLYGNDMWKYDINDDEWDLVQAAGPIPSKRQAPQSMSIPPNFFINGGETLDVNTFAFETPGDTLVFNIEDDSWYNITPCVSPDARNYAASAEVKGDWIMYGGEIEGNQIEGCGSPLGQNVGKDLWKYSVEYGIWVQLTFQATGDKPPPLKRAMAVSKGSDFFMVSGFDFICVNGTGPGQVYNNNVFVLSI